MEEQGNVNINKMQYSFLVGDWVCIWLVGNCIIMDDIMDFFVFYINFFIDGVVFFFGAIVFIYLFNDNFGFGVGFFYNFIDDLSLGGFYFVGKGFFFN